MPSLFALVACGAQSGEEVAEQRASLSWDHVLARVTASDATYQLINAPQSSTHGVLIEDGREHPLFEMGEPTSLPFSDINPKLSYCPNCTLHNNTFSATNKRHSPISTLLVGNHPECDANTCLSFRSEWPWSLNDSLRITEYNDRLEVLVTDEMTINQWSYFRFFLLLGTDTQATPAHRDTLLTQIWQIHSPEPWRAPIFAASLHGDPANGFYVEFNGKNDDGGFTVPVAANGDTRSWITPGVWASFHFAFKPVPLPRPGQSTPPGAIHIFRDRGLAFVPGNGAVPINQGNTSYYWGYRPVNNTTSPKCESVASCVSEKVHVRVGFYRNETSDGPALPRLSFEVDSVKVTTDEAYMPGY